jgi:alpha-beta hydrolase superfamily lysophospholipase
VDWIPEAAALADLVIIHGYGEHSARYAPVAEAFTAQGIHCHGFDLRGHGESVGLRRGDVDDFDLLVDDVAAFVATVRTDRPLFVYGHSMGGLAVVRLAERASFHCDGLIIASAALLPAESIPAPLVKVTNLLGRLAPGLRTIALDPNAVSRVQEVRDDYDHDPLNFRGKLTAGTGRQMNLAFAQAVATADRITEPILIIHGGADQLTSAKGSRLLAESVGSKDCTLRIWPDAFHELHHEPEREEVISTIAEWILARTAQR